ncbi:MAG: thiamine transporter permease, partial [Paenibacillus sp.]|nr:thiamine transporter permease [Paenibacillus sp.]
ADWIIDMGPDGGSKGGQVVFEGTPSQILLAEQSITGRYLK